MPIYRFQESKIWTSGNPVDSLMGKTFKTKRTTKAKALKALPLPGTGRVWVLLSIDGKPVS